MTVLTTALLPARVIAAALGQFPPTDEQTAVIEAPLEPALVVAGAGSGKTETMASRVVWLVANGIVRRDEVLGLTFTRKAAGELAERIQRRLARLAEFETRGLLPSLGALHAEGRLDVFAELERSGIEGARAQSARHEAMDVLARSVGAERQAYLQKAYADYQRAVKEAPEFTAASDALARFRIIPKARAS